MSGGALVAEVLQRHGIRALFTLCGGHISPILVECKRRGLRVVDMRDEASAVFAADAASRLTGLPGVAAVTAGPGVTNTATAVQNAFMARSPVLILGGATATMLRGKGSLQDIDQMAVMRPLVKWAERARRVRDLPGLLARALEEARSGVPGPVFLECPVDLLYDEAVVRDWYLKGAGRNPLARLFVGHHLRRLFGGADRVRVEDPALVDWPEPDRKTVRRVWGLLEKARRPVLIVGSQTVARPPEVADVAAAVRALGVPTWLSGTARGLLGTATPLQFRHKRTTALREADLVILAGVPQDFRLGYGRQIHRRAVVVSVNWSREEIKLNRRPTIGLLGDPGRFLQRLGAGAPRPVGRRAPWVERLRLAEDERDRGIDAEAARETGFLNPVRLCQEIDRRLPERSLLVADGGDFVATASYVIRPRGPLTWLDPGPFGTLGVGGGFAVGAALCRPDHEVWLLYGDGSAAWSLAEFDTCVRHGLPVIAVVGNDGSWAQIAREQVEVLGDPVGTELLRSDYHVVAEGFGAAGLLLERPEDTVAVLAQAQDLARAGRPVLINAKIGRTEFRKGSLSM